MVLCISTFYQIVSGTVQSKTKVSLQLGGHWNVAWLIALGKQDHQKPCFACHMEFGILANLFYMKPKQTNKKNFAGNSNGRHSTEDRNVHVEYNSYALFPVRAIMKTI